MRGIAAVVALILLLPGCSLRGWGPREGQIEAMQVVPRGAGEGPIVRVKGAFAGEQDGVSLSLVPTADRNRVEVRVLATAAYPPFGWTAIPVDRTSTYRYEVEATMPPLARGTWTFQAMAPGDDVATFEARLSLD